MTTILNLSHPITAEQVAANFENANIITVPVQIKPIAETPFDQQITSLVDAVGFTTEQWQTEVFLVNLPGLAMAAAGVITEIHGRCGYFPKILIMERTPSGFSIAGVSDLQDIRDDARTRRF